MSDFEVTCNQSCREMGSDSLSLAVRFQLSFIKPKFEMNMQNIITSDAQVTSTSKELIVLLLLQEWTLFGMPAHFPDDHNFINCFCSIGLQTTTAGNYLPNIVGDELLLNFGARFQR